MTPPVSKALRRLLLVGGVILAAGCASVPSAPGAKINPVDPWENFNRRVFSFNEAVDEAVLKPVAQVYRDWVPQLVRTGVSNFFGNIGDVWSAANHILQGKFATGFEQGMRVATNTTIGLGGILDPATELKMPRRSEDFGQTLGVWGLPAGPYLMLPLLGPSSARDAAGLPLDRYAGTTTIYFDVNAYLTSVLQLVNVRAELLATTALLTDISLDKYSFVRDAYLARRLDQVYDGAPPLEKFEDEGADPPPKKGN